MPDLTQEGLAARDVPERIWAGEVNGYGQWWRSKDVVGQTPYILATAPALAASPEGQALIATEGERAARICEALMRKGVSPEKWPDYFRVRSAGDALLAAAIRKDEELK